MKRIHLLTLVALAHAQWDTLISPTSRLAYLKLSNDELIRLNYSNDFTSGQTITTDAIITPPTEGNYSLALANGELYALYPDDETMGISLLQDNEWEEVEYNTTLSGNTTQYYDEASVMTSYDEDEDREVIYIYGGRQDTSVTNRLLEFDPVKGTLQKVMTSVGPTSFYGASNAILDVDFKSNILIGGKASSGWVSMFQIAVWDYGSWTFKTVKSSDFNVNSRVNALVIPVFPKDDGSDVESVVVLGGTLGNDWASPYVLTLNMTSDWKWQNMTNVGDFSVKKCLGAVVINETLISIMETSNSKRDNSEYELMLYNVNNFNSVTELKVDATSSSVLSSSTKLSSSSHVSSTSSSVVVSHTSTTSSFAPISSVSASLTHTRSNGNHHSSTTTIIAIATVVPVVCITLISALLYFLYRKFTSSQLISDTDSDTTIEYSDEYYKAMSYDQASISSWNAKRDEFRRSVTTPRHTTSMEFTFEGSTPQSTPSRPSTHQSSPSTMSIALLKGVYQKQTQRRGSGPFANPEDYADRTELSPMTMTNPSRTSLMSRSDDEEEKRIDEFLGQRDVQVLVSSKRRSKLRITNPDVEEEEAEAEEHEDEAALEREDVGSIGTESTFADDLKMDFGQDEEYFREVLKVFDDDSSMGSGTDVQL